jgi:hypothetical protein
VSHGSSVVFSESMFEYELSRGKGSRSASSRLVEDRWVSSETREMSAAGSGGATPGSDVSSALAKRPFGAARWDGAQTTGPGGATRAEGAGHTFEADQGHERMPNRVTAMRQLGRRTPRRVPDVTLS